MKTKILVTLSVVTMLFSCDLKKNETAQHTMDSLRSVVQANHQMTEAMVEIGVLIDSIDANRKVLRIHMADGATYESYVARMRDINQYVRKTERRIAALEKTVKKSGDKAYGSALRKLKAELDVRNHELAALKQQVDQYRSENDALISTVNLQKAEIEEKMNVIKVRQEETAQLQTQVNQLLTQSKLDQGEAYFARAQAVEETANRTKFAPKKKKSSRREALELYKLALSFGKTEAQKNITMLEKKF